MQLKPSHFIKLLSCLTIATTSICPVASQQAWEHRPILGTVLGKKPVDPGVRAGEGLLRIEILGKRNPYWSVVLDYGEYGSLVLDEQSVRTRIVREAKESLVVDVPIFPSVNVSSPYMDAGLSVRLVEVILPAATFPEQKLDNSVVRALEGVGDPENIDTGNFLAKVELLGSDATVVGICTAFRVAKGYWLTAAHCAYGDETETRRVIIEKLRMQVALRRKSVNSSTPFFGVVIASGIKRDAGDSRPIVRTRDLDYVLLEAAEDPGGRVIKLESTRSSTEQSLALFHYWVGRTDPDAGIAKSDCSILPWRGPRNDFSRPDSCPAGLQHGCSSGKGSSGGPMLDGSGRLVALHYAAGQTKKFNCAIPVARIIENLCEAAPTVARKLTSCP